MKGTLVIIPCGQRKIWDKEPNRGPTPARDAYIGPPFKVNKEYAEQFAEQWVILSAKYGLISPDFMIPGPYNVTFKDSSTDPVPVSTLQDQIQRKSLDRFERIVGLGGREYRAIVEEAFASLPVKICFPFAGLPLGKSMQAIRQAITLGKLCP